MRLSHEKRKGFPGKSHNMVNRATMDGSFGKYIYGGQFMTKLHVLGLAILFGVLCLITCAGAFEAKNLLVVMPGFTYNDSTPIALNSIDLNLNGTAKRVYNPQGSSSSTCFTNAFPASLTSVGYDRGSLNFVVSKNTCQNGPVTITPANGASVSMFCTVTVSAYPVIPGAVSYILGADTIFKVSRSQCNGNPAWKLTIN